MTLLREIQDAAVDASTSVATLLRKCKLLAARLGATELAQWVESELDGYPDGAQLPPYREFTVNSKGNFSGPFGSGLKNADIPLICIGEQYQAKLEMCRLTESASALEHVVSESDSPYATEPWSPNFVALVGQRIYQGFNCLQAWKVIPVGAIVAALDTIRNRTLDFAIELERLAPDAGESMAGTPAVTPERTTQIFNNTIHGNVQNFATGNADVYQEAGPLVTQGDIESLETFLDARGLSSEIIADLATAIRDDESDGRPGPKGMGKRVAKWVSSLFSDAASGVGKITAAVAAKVVSEGVNAYLGI